MTYLFNFLLNNGFNHAKISFANHNSILIDGIKTKKQKFLCFKVLNFYVLDFCRLLKTDKKPNLKNRCIKFTHRILQIYARN